MIVITRLEGWGKNWINQINSSLGKTTVLGCSPLGWLVAGEFLPASPAADATG